jgi:hypothetical protein
MVEMYFGQRFFGIVSVSPRQSTFDTGKGIQALLEQNPSDASDWWFILRMPRFHHIEDPVFLGLCPFF